MSFLYDSLDFLPAVMQRPVVALLIITIGFVFSKILAASLGAIIPEKQVLNPLKTDDVLPLRPRIIRSSFWVSWLLCFIIGYSQLPLLRLSVNNFSTGIGNPLNQALIFLGSGIMMTLEPRFDKLKLFAKTYFASRKFPKLNGTARLLLRLIWIPILAISGLALSNPESTELKVTATILVLFLGYILAFVFNAATASIIGIRATEPHKTLKFLFYFIFAIFCVVAMRIWT